MTGAMPDPHEMQRSAFLEALAQEAFFGTLTAEVMALTGPGVGGVEEEDEGQRVPAQPGRRGHHARQRDRDHDQRHQHLEPRPAARAPQHPHTCMQQRTAAPQRCAYTGLCTPQDSNMCVPALQCLVEMSRLHMHRDADCSGLTAQQQASSGHTCPGIQHAHLAFQNTCQELQVHVSRDDITTRCFRCRWVRTQ